MIRDNALAVSDLLNQKMFGPSVRPYQPENVWKTPTAGNLQYKHHTDDRLYRKSLYTFWRRNIGPANMFDSSTRRVCQVNVRRTNTPLHALTTLNDVTFVEAARVLAEQLLDCNENEEAIAKAFHRILFREPYEIEKRELLSLIVETQEHDEANADAANSLLSVGETDSDSREPARHAALTNMVLLILNMDETLCHF